MTILGKQIKQKKHWAAFAFIAFLIVAVCTNSDNAPKVKRNTHPQTELLILGTAHLSRLDGLEPEMVEPILAVLENYGPNLIAIESSSATSVQAMLAQPKLHVEPLTSYAKLHSEMGLLAQNSLGISWREATETHSEKKHPCRSEPATEHCILIALASFEYYTAFVRWNYLSATRKSQFISKHPVIGERLQRFESSKNEYIILAAELAKRLKHDRLYQIDDHLEKGPTNIMLDHVGNGFDPIQTFWNSTRYDHRGPKNSRIRSQAIKPGGLMRLYLWLNSEEYMAFDYDTQFAPMDQGKVGDSGYVFRAYFEARNLRMAANITNVLAENPISKMVVIVGASHKKFLDSYFEMMPWVTVVQLPTIIENQGSE